MISFLKYNIRLRWIQPLMVLYFFCISGELFAQAPPSQRLKDLLVQYRQHAIPETTYLKGVDSAAMKLYNEDSLAQWLDTYREIAFGEPGYGKYRARYYRHMIRLSDNKSRNGSAIYYAEKENEEDIRSGEVDKDEIPQSDVYALGAFIENDDYNRVFAKYETLRSRIESMPASIDSGGRIASPKGLARAFDVVEANGEAGFSVKDTTRLNGSIKDCEIMLERVLQQREKYKDYLNFYQYEYHRLCLYREKARGQVTGAERFLAMCLEEVRAKQFGGIGTVGYTIDTYEDAFEFYFNNGRQDSAWHFLRLLREMAFKSGQFTNSTLSYVQDNSSKLLAKEGKYHEAYKELLEANSAEDTALYSVSADRDNNLYALAEEEDAQKKIALAEEKRQKVERFNTWLFAVLGVLIACGAIAFLLLRSRQRRHVMNFQLSLARSFQKEIDPMLGKAGNMIGSESEAHPSPRLEELSRQMGIIREALRSLADDLSSRELSTVYSFSRDLSDHLEKIKATTGIDFILRSEDGEGTLSRWQYTNLWKMVSELVTNSLKYAECTMITIGLTVSEHMLRIAYSDNGKGIAPDTGGGGIGMQNLRERARLLKGEFQLKNAWPEGYSINISIPML